MQVNKLKKEKTKTPENGLQASKYSEEFKSKVAELEAFFKFSLWGHK